MTHGTAGHELLHRVRSRLADRATVAGDPRVTLGPNAVLVELTHPEAGHLAGIAHRPEGTASERVTSESSVSDLAALATDAPDGGVDRAVGIATLNALSAPDVQWQTGDPMASLRDDVEVVATVGLFRPAFKRFGDVEVRVVERDVLDPIDAPADVTVSTYAPAACEAAFADADVCFITGSTLVYGGIDRYLSALSDADETLVVLVGATASFLPEPAFDAGIDVVAGASVADVDGVRAGVLAGGCGTELHERGLEKVYVARKDRLPGLTLQGSADGGARR